MADKNLFAINITDDADNQTPDHTPFVTNQVPSELWETSGKAWRDYAKYVAKKSGAISALYTVAFVGFVLTLCMIWQVIDPMINAETRWTLVQSLTKQPEFPITGAVTLLLTIVMGVLIHSKNKAYANDPVRATMEQACQRIDQEIQDVLHVPEDAASFDILPVYYRIEDGRWGEVLGTDNIYQNMAVNLWGENDCVCLCDDYMILAIPKTAFQGYYTIDAVFMVTEWHKEEDCVDFDVGEAGRDGYEVHTYYDVVIQHGDDLYDLLIPSYDFSLLTDMVDLPCLDRPDV